MERFILIIALVSCIIAGGTLYSCAVGTNKNDNGYTTADFVKHVAMKKKYKNSN